MTKLSEIMVPIKLVFAFYAQIDSLKKECCEHAARFQENEDMCARDETLSYIEGLADAVNIMRRLIKERTPAEDE